MKAEGVKVGATVVVSRFADGDRDVGGDKLMILPETEIMALEEG
jgi:co-chaperonin GroES (HSP10)